MIVAIGVAGAARRYSTQPWLNWVGLMTHKPATEDYVPLFPWFGVVLIGIAVGAWLVSEELPAAAAVSRASPRHG